MTTISLPKYIISALVILSTDTQSEWNIYLKEAKNLPMFWTFVLSVTLIILTVL